MRTTINVYRQLYKFCEAVDAEAVARGEGPIDKSIDNHFRSGVYLGMGMSILILSMLPTKLLTIVELFGYRGDRHEALEILCRAGGWTKDSDQPSVSTGAELMFTSRQYFTLLQPKKAYEDQFAIWLF